MAVIPGHIKNETLIIGCHRDGMLFRLRRDNFAYHCIVAWVMGAADPTSGTVSLAEVIRAYGALLESGWKPLRNILIASWDAEEVRDNTTRQVLSYLTNLVTQYGLIGSTEWAEDFAEWIQSHAIAYLNVGMTRTSHLPCRRSLNSTHRCFGCRFHFRSRRLTLTCPPYP